MSTKKRAAVAVALSAAAGSTAGAVACRCGLELQESAKLGAVVSGAVGNLLYQAFRLVPAATDEAAAVDEAHDTALDSNNGPTGARDTVDHTDVGHRKVPTPRRGEPGPPKDSRPARHRRLRRAGRRRLERALGRERSVRGAGGGHGTA
ncbi:hypothetical protein [Streptomyces mangrovisoli]|nr:hypothetical protein [Streptomyces mangrovisoli]